LAIGTAPSSEHRLVRVLLLALGLLVPLNLPFSVPPLGADASPGWFVAVETKSPKASTADGSPSGQLRVTRVSRRARQAGVLPGDVLVAVDGVPATLNTLAARRARMESGELVALDLVRRGVSTHVRVQVDTATIGYRVYTTYVLLLTCVSWLVGMALVGWRGSSTFGLLSGGALLLVPPIAFSSGVPGDGMLLSAVRWLWHMEASAFRLFLPALLLHALTLQARRPVFRSRALWLSIYGALILVLLVVTQFGRDPLSWTQPGVLRSARMLVGSLLETVTAAYAGYLFLRAGVTHSVTLRLVYGAIATALASAAAYSSTTLLLGPWFGEEFVSGVNSVATFFLPTALALHFFGPGRQEDRAWNAPRWASLTLSLALTAVHGLVIFASVAVVLNGSGQDLDGNEWLLFATVVAATLLPAPAFRWLRAMVDRRLMSRWVRAEANAQEFVYELSGELDPARIAQRVAEAIPSLLDVTHAELLFVGDAPQASVHAADDQSAYAVRSTSLAALHDMRAGDARDGVTLFPVWGPDRATIAALRIGSRTDGRPIDPPARVLITTICQGVSAALAAAKAHIDLRRAGEDLADAERIAAVGSLSGGLAHEIKNPLAGLKMGVYVLRRDGIDPVKLQRLERDVGRIDDLVSGLLRLTSAGAEHGDPAELLDVRPIAQACVNDLRSSAEDRGIVIVEEYPSEQVLVRGAALQFRLIVLNLVANAIDSVGEGGRVHVVLDVSAAGTTISVGDNGPGIADDVVDRVFDLHFTTKRNGTGLGLALVRREAERLGGNVKVAESSAHGTMMKVSLPRWSEAYPANELEPHGAAAISDH
jgi:signal transduction histidine kinase